MTDINYLREEIAQRISDEPSDSSYFYGHQERVNNLIDSATGAGLYSTIFKGPPNMFPKAACFIAVGVLPDPFPRV